MSLSQDNTVINVQAEEIKELPDISTGKPDNKENFPKKVKGKKLLEWKKDMKRNWVMYCIFIPVAIFFIVFNYIPMVGVIMSFQKVSISSPIFGNEFVGWDNFSRLFSGDTFGLVMRNTIMMALLNITIGFIIPIILALLISEVTSKFFRRTVQTVSYMPYFISAVVISQLVKEFVGSEGFITMILSWFGMEKADMLSNPNVPVFWFINCFTEVWQGAGYASIVFVAAIFNVNADLHEAAALDGAGRFKRIIHITLPSILPIVVMMFTIKVGTILTSGFDKVLLLYNSGIWDTADCLSTYTYRIATQSGDGGLSSAAGLFQSVIATALLFLSNWLSRATAKTSLV